MKHQVKLEPKQLPHPEIGRTHCLHQDQLENSKAGDPLKKNLQPCKKDNVNSLILSVIIATIGSTTMNLPQKVSQLGIFPFVLAVCLSALFAYAGYYMIDLIIAQGTFSTYSEMVQLGLGPRFKKCSDVVLMLFNFTQTIIIQVVFIKFSLQILHDTLHLPLYEDRNLEIYSAQGKVYCVMVGIIMIIANVKFFMMTHLRDVLLTIGKFSLFGFLFCILIVVCTAFSGFTRAYTEQDLVYKSVFKMDGQHVQSWKPMSWNYIKTLAQGTSVIFFIFMLHHMYLPILKDLETPTKQRIERVLRWSEGIQSLLFIIFGILSYLLLAQHAHVMPVSALVISSIPTTPITIAKCMITLSLLFKVSIPAFNTKQAIYSITGLQRNESNLIKLYLAICLSTIAIAIAFQKITVYFSILGGTFGIIIGAVFPILCARNIAKFGTFQKWVSVFMAVMSLFCLFGAITSVISPA